ncbi:hypothetical protein GGD65_007871 [Bradyrhizobium sp. CIR18]|uniref:hypothetical protein n=1 Tax=Bradyrhizobium sp. CIR18 TaxID=2663839 RepID=UPI0016058F3C|nr:hypothetical protein [Bradyrhizobium sp. CIR18]MBB4366797.1 hypothetical protein [Bradyrhizobium sp. CIR18]
MRDSYSAAWFQNGGGISMSRVMEMLAGALLAVALIWFSMWLAGPPRCAFTPQVRVGGMLVGGCSRC